MITQQMQKLCTAITTGPRDSFKAITHCCCRSNEFCGHSTLFPWGVETEQGKGSGDLMVQSDDSYNQTIIMMWDKLHNQYQRPASQTRPQSVTQKGCQLSDLNVTEVMSTVQKLERNSYKDFFFWSWFVRDGYPGVKVLPFLNHWTEQSCASVSVYGVSVQG